MSNLDDYIRKLPTATQDIAWDLAWVVQGSADQVQEGWSIAKNYIFSSDASSNTTVVSSSSSSTTTFFGLGGGSSALPPPPPPPLVLAPPSHSLASLDGWKDLSSSTDRFLRAHPYAVGGSALVLTGATVAFVGLGSEGRRVLWRRVKEGGEEMTGKVVQRRREREEARTAKERPLNRDGHRMEVVVLLGADASPLGFPLVLFLESQGFIVVASVSTIQAGAALEKLANGFVRAIVLDASQASSVDPFLSSLKGVLTLKFPINSAAWTYAFLPSLIPTSVMNILLRRASPTTTPRPLPSATAASSSARRPPQSDAARAAGQAAAQRQQTAPPPASEPSDDDGHHTLSDTDSVPSSMEASTSGLGDSWVHDPTGRNGAGGGEVPLGESWADGTWGRN
ncbi:hypothetical protein BDY24DRAFT_254600 [Mrakia frigida]|uniref:uncharacterized protein n=1 Tax=Mrakia frigida TaxID=29902 RepID=UPI003FCBFE4F